MNILTILSTQMTLMGLTNLPNTGQRFGLAPIIGLMLIGLAIIIFAIIKRRKKDEE